MGGFGGKQRLHLQAQSLRMCIVIKVEEHDELAAGFRDKMITRARDSGVLLVNEKPYSRIDPLQPALWRLRIPGIKA